MPRWRITPRSVTGAAACLLFAAAVLIAPFEELSAYPRNRVYLFRDLGALIGEGAVRGLFALLFVAAGVAALRGPHRRGRP
jgi:hypothetical protein